MPDVLTTADSRFRYLLDTLTKAIVCATCIEILCSVWGP